MKVVFISSMLPSGHYSQYLTSGLNVIQDIELLVYADKQTKNLTILGCGKIKNVWSKSVFYIMQIMREVIRDRPQVVHIQHELNMYGGIATAAIFPILLIILRAIGVKLIVTVHASVYKNQINKEFVSLFHKDSKFFHPLFLKFFFQYIFTSINLLSNRIIVHTQLAKDILFSDYKINESKIYIIPISIPIKNIQNSNKQTYFLYFGYMVRRKGLGFALAGFKKFIEKNPSTAYKLVLAGGVIGGQEKALDEIMDMIRVNGLQDKVEIKGFVLEAELDQLYWNAEAVIIPAKISMGSSGPLFHAISYGKCVIASNVGHFLEDIDHLNNGVLTENLEWDNAFQMIADHPELVSKIEIAVAEKAISRTPSIIALSHAKVYKSAFV
jgi:glycosyltransferase involved in cell wall biosynthesis